MKKTFQVNINGIIFNIDEDAYELLLTYLDQLHASFPGAEGEEIVADIECRIAELLLQRDGAEQTVVELAHINTVIETMGKPEAINYDEYADENATATTDNAATAAATADNTADDAQLSTPVRKRFYRSSQNKVFGGVIGGIGQYFDWDATIMRILIVILACATYVWPMIIAYMIVWMVIPQARTTRQMLEMKGEPVNVGTVGQFVQQSSMATPPPYHNNNAFGSFVNTVFGIAGRCLMGLIGLMSFIAGAGCIVMILVFAFGLIELYSYGVSDVLQTIIGWSDSLQLAAWSIIMWLFTGLIVAIALVWMASCVVFKVHGASRTTIFTGIVLLILAIAAGITLTMLAHASYYAFAPVVSTTMIGLAGTYMC